MREANGWWNGTTWQFVQNQHYLNLKCKLRILKSPLHLHKFMFLGLECLIDVSESLPTLLVLHFYLLCLVYVLLIHLPTHLSANFNYAVALTLPTWNATEVNDQNLWLTFVKTLIIPRILLFCDEHRSFFNIMWTVYKQNGSPQKSVFNRVLGSVLRRTTFDAEPNSGTHILQVTDQILLFFYF